MIVIDSKRKKRENILKKYPGAIIADVTSHAEDDLIKLSPFYPHDGILVSFRYSFQATILEHCFTKLADFCNPPRLVSCKDPLEEEGFKQGEFVLDDSSVVFAASDALSHYILMMYELAHCKEFGEELAEEYLKHSGNSQLLKTAETLRFNFKNDVIDKLIQASDNQLTFEEYLKGLYHQGVIDMDDFTICWLCKQ